MIIKEKCFILFSRGKDHKKIIMTIIKEEENKMAGIGRI